LRQQQAEATRSRVLAAAAQLFATEGYARATLAKVAAAAGVSAETVQGIGPKAALLIAAIEYTTLGVAGEENVFDLDLGRELLDIQDPAKALDFIVDIQADIYERGAALGSALLGGATADTELKRYLDEFLDGVTLQIRRVLEKLADRGWLRTDVDFDELVETTAVLSGFETYLRITRRDGWTAQRYRAWCRRILAETVFVSGSDR
jgi:AcrR family transcriptional regulator